MATIEVTVTTGAGSITRTMVSVSDANMDRAIAYFRAIDPSASTDAAAFTDWVSGLGRELKQDVLRYERDQAAAAAADGVGDIEEV